MLYMRGLLLVVVRACCTIICTLWWRGQRHEEDRRCGNQPGCHWAGGRSMNGPATTDAAPLLARFLGEVPRRYRLGELPAPFAAQSDPHGANQLAILIEHARLALAAGQPPDPATKERYLLCLEALIRDAIQPECVDSTFQLMVLLNHTRLDTV